MHDSGSKTIYSGQGMSQVAVKHAARISKTKLKDMDPDDMKPLDTWLESQRERAEKRKTETKKTSQHDDDEEDSDPDSSDSSSSAAVAGSGSEPGSDGEAQAKDVNPLIASPTKGHRQLPPVPKFDTPSPNISRRGSGTSQGTASRRSRSPSAQSNATADDDAADPDGSDRTDDSYIIV